VRVTCCKSSAAVSNVAGVRVSDQRAVRTCRPQGSRTEHLLFPANASRPSHVLVTGRLFGRRHSQNFSELSILREREQPIPCREGVIVARSEMLRSNLGTARGQAHAFLHLSRQGLLLVQFIKVVGPVVLE
jgi:hypothetical protein